MFKYGIDMSSILKKPYKCLRISNSLNLNNHSNPFIKISYFIEKKFTKTPPLTKFFSLQISPPTKIYKISPSSIRRM